MADVYASLATQILKLYVTENVNTLSVYTEVSLFNNTLYSRLYHAACKKSLLTKKTCSD